MRAWIQANHEWVFSGVGVVLVSSVIALIRSIAVSKRKGKRVHIQQTASGANETLIGIQNNYYKGSEENE